MDSRCVKVPKSLAMRIHRCDKCNLVMDRDYNASINILQKGLKIFNLYAKADYHKLPQFLQDITAVKISMKQEETTQLVR